MTVMAEPQPGMLAPSAMETTRVLAGRFAAEYLPAYTQAGMPYGACEDGFVRWARERVIRELQAAQTRGDWEES